MSWRCFSSGLCHVGCARMAGHWIHNKKDLFWPERRPHGFLLILCPGLLSLWCVLLLLCVFRFGIILANSQLQHHRFYSSSKESAEPSQRCTWLFFGRRSSACHRLCGLQSIKNLLGQRSMVFIYGGAQKNPRDLLWVHVRSFRLPLEQFVSYRIFCRFFVGHRPRIFEICNFHFGNLKVFSSNALFNLFYT